MDTQNFQDLQEISKKLLGSYVAKAGEDLLRNKNKQFRSDSDAEYHASGGNRHTGPNPELAAKARAAAKTYSDKASRRARGLAMAGKKINELEEGKLKNALIAGALGAAMGAGAGVATPHLSDFKSTIQDKVGQTGGIKKLGDTERAKQGIRDQIGLGHDTPAGARAGIAGAAGGALGVASAFRRRKTNESTTHEESSLREYVNNVVKRIMEDIQTPERAEQQRKRIKSAERSAIFGSWRNRADSIGRLRQLQRIDAREKADTKTTWGVSEPHHIRGHDESTPRRSRKRNVQEDVFDSNQSSRASRQNVKKATKTLGASSPHTKALEKLHRDMKNSPFVYGTADNEVNRREFGDENYGKKPTLTPMTRKAWSGYDASFGGGQKGINLGVIKKAAAAIRKGRGGNVVSEGAVEKIKKILGMTPKPKEENPNDYEVIRPYRGGAKLTRRKTKAKEEPKPGLLDRLDRLYPG